MLESLLHDVGNQIIEALASELGQPEARAQLERNVTQIASRALGVNLRAPIVHDIWKAQYDKLEGGLFGFLAVAASQPPHSVDAAADIVKESVSGQVDSFAERLKTRLAEKTVAVPSSQNQNA